MELYLKLDAELVILKITGNSRFRILNDYENGLIDKNCIEIDVHDAYTLYITVNHGDLLDQLETNNKKKYIKFSYRNSIPIISIIWEFDKFTPSYAIHPISNIKDKTCEVFKIKKHLLNIDSRELWKNNKILDKEFHSGAFFRNWGTYKKKMPRTIPIISRYGKFIKLMPNRTNVTVEDYEQKIRDF